MRAAAVVALTLFCSLAFAATDPRLKDAVKLYSHGKYVEAEAALERLVQDKALGDKDRAEVRMYLAATHLARKDQVAAKLELKELAREYPHARLDPGEFVPQLVKLEQEAHAEVEAEARARPPEEKKETVREITARAPTAPPPDQTFTAPPPPPAPAPKSSGLRTGAYVALGAGAAMLAGGGVLGLMSRQAASDVEELKTVEGGVASENAGTARDLLDKVHNRALAANVLFGVGGVAAVAGAALFAVSLNDAPATATVAPVAGGAVFALDGRF